jgi:hypothetical protein
MRWDQITASLKQLTGKVLPAPRAAPGRGASRNASKDRPAIYDGKQDEPQMTPYSPDDRDERNTFSLHISC